jgi:5-methylcytosine-specific restriction endonuclease McrA
MKSYVKKYLEYFGYGPEDFIPCEICSKKAVDIHHVEPRSKRMDLLNDIQNIMALCRECHNKYGDVPEKKDWLRDIHLQKMNC